MKKNSSRMLINNLENKGICFAHGEKTLFLKYDYYQTINAYKNLFIKSVETIDDIYNNIQLNRNISDYQKQFGIKNIIGNDLFFAIAEKTIKKYGLTSPISITPQNYIDEINKINFTHHIYINNTKYSDFIRMYKFEHELRLLLLRYTLIIEENMKNIFISTLNNKENITPNFLSDINNYNTSDYNNNSALNTLRLIIEKHGNKHSKPIKRKREQNLTIPYWILINELAMNQTYTTITNLNTDISNEIFQSCLNHFTKLNVDIFDKSKSSALLLQEKQYIDKFMMILDYIGEFRNMLAHNQPIYNYNIKDTSLINFPDLNYRLPFKKNKKLSKLDQQKMNTKLLNDCQQFFGIDKYNSRTSFINIDLSTLIYFIFKIINHIDSNNKLYDEIKNVFSKYNIIFSIKKFNVNDVSKCQELIKEISNLQYLNFNYESINDKINDKLPFKRDLISFNSEFNKMKKALFDLSNRVSFSEDKSKYNVFIRNNIYTKYTGISINYFNDIK